MNKQNYKEVSTIGRWGRMHGRYLKDNHPVRYTVLLLSGKLNGYLVEFDQQAKKQLELIVQQMAEREDVTEELKASDQMEWVRRMWMCKTAYLTTLIGTNKNITTNKSRKICRDFRSTCLKKVKVYNHA